MQDVLSMIYLWLVIFWMAGLFMLPRFFVYHQEAEIGSAEAARWVDREKKLLKIILLPSIILVWLLGLSLLGTGMVAMGGWFHAKLLLVLLLSGYHGYLSAYAKKLARGEQPISGKKLRFLNEIPGIAAALIVILVIVKPF
jgi:putative membrane protein